MDVVYVAKLANLPLDKEQADILQSSLAGVMGLVDRLQKLDTSDVKLTSHVTDSVNVTRPDEVDYGRVLSQDQALANAHASGNGYFKVPAIF